MHSQYFGFMYCGYCEYLQYFEVLYCGYFRTRSILGFVTAVNTPCIILPSISGFCTAGTASTGNISSLVLRVLAVPKYSQHAQYTRRMEYTSTICDHRVYHLYIHAHCFAENISQMVPRVGVGANYFRWVQLEYFRVPAVFRVTYCEDSRYFEVLY